MDRDAGALQENAKAVARAFPDVAIEVLIADFRHDLRLPQLDGLVAANSLHFVPRSEQVAVIARLARRLKPGGTFVVVEYDADSGNHWVPNPFSAGSWPALAASSGLVAPRVLARVPSRFLGAIYAASAEASRG